MLQKTLERDFQGENGLYIISWIPAHSHNGRNVIE